MTQLTTHPRTSPDIAELAESFRRAMSHVAGPVAVVTTCAAGTPAGSTVSAFVSLSMDPPMLLVSLARGSRLLSLLSAGPSGSVVGVNVLGAGQAEVAHRFATPHADRFAGVAWQTRSGAPALAGTHAWVALRVASLVPAGDHVLVLGDVLEASADSFIDPAEGLAADPSGPLTYHRRSFGTHLAH